MQFQKEPGIYLYFKKRVLDDYFNIKIDVIYYETLEHFFWSYNEFDIKKNIGYFIDDKICQYIIGYKYFRGYNHRRYISGERYCNKINCKEHIGQKTNIMVVYDENGNQYIPDVLVGLYRAWRNNKKASKEYRNLHHRRINGQKKGAWAGCRSMRTFQERRMAEAWDDDENAPKVRRARVAGNLPDPWDDYLRHIEKSWKTQSKRKYQWKER